MEAINRNTNIVRLARGILSGELDFVVASTRLAGISHSIGFENARSCLVSSPREFSVFDAMANQISRANIPLGQPRQFWSPQVLANKDEQLKQIVEEHREAAMAACHALIEAYHWRSHWD